MTTRVVNRDHAKWNVLSQKFMDTRVHHYQTGGVKMPDNWEVLLDNPFSL